MTTCTKLTGNLARLQLGFTYDHQRRCIRKTVAEWTGSAYDLLTADYSLYDSWNLIAMLQHVMTSIRTYVWGTDLATLFVGFHSG